MDIADLQLFIIAKINELTFTKVNLSSSLVSSKILDSITAVDLAVAIEEKSGIQIPFTEISEVNFETVDKIISYLQTKMQ